MGRKKTCCGQPTARVWGYKKIFLIVTLVELAALIGVISYTLSEYDYPLRDDEQRSGFSLTLAMLWAVIAAIDFVLEAMLFEKRLMLSFFIVGCMLLEAYVIFDYFEGALDHWERQFRLIVVSCAVPLNIASAAYVISDMGFYSFHVVGADRRMQHAYQLASYFVSWTRLDVVIAIALVIMSAIPGLLTDLQIILTIVGLLFTVLWAALGYAFAFWEMKILMWPFLLLALVEPTFIVYQVYNISAQDFGEGIITYPTLILCGLAVGLRVLVIICMVRVNRECEGLGDIIFGYNSLDAALKVKNTGYSTFSSPAAAADDSDDD
eukprot:m.11860 g.11860  ORF g.11860 m.11860 type:complete len:322 (+) comp9876_c0_seq1:261-1226(+)